MKSNPYANNGRKRFPASEPIIRSSKLDTPCKMATHVNTLGRATRANENYRRVWIDTYGPVPDGLDIGHVCHDVDVDCPGGNTCPHRACYELTHLAPQTRSENLSKARYSPERRAMLATVFKRTWDGWTEDQRQAFREKGRVNAMRRHYGE